MGGGASREIRLEMLGERSRKAALKEFGRALRANRPAEAEEAARRALALATDAFNYLEDTDGASQCHDTVHAIGEYVASNFGCDREHNGKIWLTRCPLLLSHFRIGFSMGFTATRFCTICGEDIFDCPHILGHEYPRFGGPGPGGDCLVCGADDCLDHMQGNEYLAEAQSVIRDVDELREVSLVPRPRDPLARISALSLLQSEVASCSIPTGGCPCRGGCPGFVEADCLVQGVSSAY
jgi:hypothetical protein